MKRFLAHLLLLLVAALWLAVFLLRVASFAAALQIRHESTDRLLLIRIQSHGVFIDTVTPWLQDDGWTLNTAFGRGSSFSLHFQLAPGSRWRPVVPGISTASTLAIFDADVLAQSRTLHETHVDWWLILAIVTVIALPPWYLHRTRITEWRHRRRRGLCLACGYDLRGSTDRCPECGADCPPPRVRRPRKSSPA